MNTRTFAPFKPEVPKIDRRVEDGLQISPDQADTILYLGRLLSEKRQLEAEERRLVDEVYPKKFETLIEKLLSMEINFKTDSFFSTWKDEGRRSLLVQPLKAYSPEDKTNHSVIRLIVNQNEYDPVEETRSISTQDYFVDLDSGKVAAYEDDIALVMYEDHVSRPVIFSDSAPIFYYYDDGATQLNVGTTYESERRTTEGYGKHIEVIDSLLQGLQYFENVEPQTVATRLPIRFANQ